MKRPNEMSSKDREEFLSMVHAAYTEKGLVPTTQAFGVESDGGPYKATWGCCCPLGALLVGTQPDLTDFEAGQLFIPDIWGDLERLTGWSKRELSCFVRCFDEQSSAVLGDTEERRTWQLAEQTKGLLWS